jgi:hypothetical protein
MTRTVLAAAAALLGAATLASTSAQACLSCEYVPEVVRPHATSPLAYGRGDNEVSRHGSYGSYSVKRRVAKSEHERPAKVTKALKADKQPKIAKVEKAEKTKVAEAEKAERSEPVKVAKAEPVKADPVAKKTAQSESSSITVASADAQPVVTKTSAPKHEAAAKPTDCKKFFASVGMTLTVPCE